jgi:gluconokinase
LLQSQLDTLEPPGADEAIEVDIVLSPEKIVDTVLMEMKSR